MENISDLVAQSFDRELDKSKACCQDLSNTDLAGGFVEGFVACFCLRTFGEIDEFDFQSLCERAFVAWDI